MGPHLGLWPRKPTRGLSKPLGLPHGRGVGCQEQVTQKNRAEVVPLFMMALEVTKHVYAIVTHHTQGEGSQVPLSMEGVDILQHEPGGWASLWPSGRILHTLSPLRQPCPHVLCSHGLHGLRPLGPHCKIPLPGPLGLHHVSWNVGIALLLLTPHRGTQGPHKVTSEPKPLSPFLPLPPQAGKTGASRPVAVTVQRGIRGPAYSKCSVSVSFVS